jgi:purine-binding chemotaxis protein CheW
VNELRGRRLEVLIFEIGGQRHALWSAEIRKLVRAITIFPLPRAPEIVEGIIDVRGTVVPVIDIRARFRLPAKPAAHTDHLILAWAGPRLVALRADRALDLARLEPSDVHDAKAIVSGADHVAGVAKLSDGLVLIHDLRSFLSQAEATALDDALVANHDYGSP